MRAIITTLHYTKETIKENVSTCGQGCRKFETLRFNKILNPKLFDEMRNILRHFAKVSKKSRIRETLTLSACVDNSTVSKN